MAVKDHYQSVIREIMRQHGIPRGQPECGHLVPKNASFTQAVQYTDYYVGKGNDEQSNNMPHYRYERYLDALQRLDMIEERIANIDIGCGAGAFSWAFLDWAIEQGISWDNLDLYGFDHSPTMIDLARDVRNRLKKEMPGYPMLHCSHDVIALLRELQETHQDGSVSGDNTDYIITLGHVLAQTANSAEAISNFARIMAHVFNILAGFSDCALVAVDAKNWSEDFRAGWDALLDRLQNFGVRCETQQVISFARIGTLHKA